MIVVNFKTYKEASGNRAVNLARMCHGVSEKTKVRIVAVPQLADLGKCVETGVECWTQHVDFVKPGRNTGFVSVENVEENGAKGTLLNHSEHKIEIARLREIDSSVFQVCVCVNDQTETKLVLEKFTPDYLAYEPAEFIGSTTKTVSTERPEIIAEMVKLASQIPVLVGAGVHTAEDVKVAVKLGARGVLLATGVVLAEDSEKALEALAGGFL